MWIIANKIHHYFRFYQGIVRFGEWQRRQFKDEAEAKSFAALKQVEQENQGRAQRMILSALSQEQHDAAFTAFDRLGSAYTLTDAVEFFLKHHRPPEFTIRLNAALALFIDEKERDGLRPRTTAALNRSVTRFIRKTDDPLTHEVTRQQVEGYLRGLRAVDQKSKATRKTWNNTLHELSGFFAWCSTADKSTNRPFTFENPASGIRAYGARQIKEEQNSKPTTTSPANVLRLFSTLSRWKGGGLVRYFALAYFAGIRPEEIQRMSGREGELINLKTRTITIPANISKTRHERQITISDNLAGWLEAYPSPLVPVNFRRMVAKVRKHFALTHDEARHSFISYHVAAFRSVGDAALQAGNSESIVKRHYLNTHTQEEGRDFFKIIPDRRRRLVRWTPKTGPQAKL